MDPKMVNTLLIFSKKISYRLYLTNKNLYNSFIINPYLKMEYLNLLLFYRQIPIKHGLMHAILSEVQIEHVSVHQTIIYHFINIKQDF